MKTYLEASPIKCVHGDRETRTNTVTPGVEEATASSAGPHTVDYPGGNVRTCASLVGPRESTNIPVFPGRSFTALNARWPNAGKRNKSGSTVVNAGSSTNLMSTNLMPKGSTTK